MTGAFDRATGRGVRVAIIDSGVNPGHPHLDGVAGGVSVTAEGESPDFLDYLGHGTAVAAAIHEKAPDALLYAVKVFDRSLTTEAVRILRAIDWCRVHDINIINLSLGTPNPAHRAAFERAIESAAAARCLIVAASDMLPGTLPGVLAAGLDWDCPRDRYRAVRREGRVTFSASGYPRPIPGVPADRNLSGASFAVANLTGFAVCAVEVSGSARIEAVESALAGAGDRTSPAAIA